MKRSDTSIESSSSRQQMGGAPVFGTGPKALVSLAVTVLGMMLCSNAWAQQTGRITGTVTDSTTGEPLPGVNVIIAGTQQGTSTGTEGNYTIAGVEPGTYTVRATFVGYQDATRDNVEVNAGETTAVDFFLQTSEIALEGVTVTALGVERERRALTSAQQSVNTASIAEARELNVSNSLSGRVAGLSVNQASTGVGGETRVVLRGNRSIAGDNQVLYIVDGVPIRGNVSDLNPDNIQNIEVLKGANAAALYGSEAQNGAIIITTKRGEAGELDVTYNGTVMARRANVLTDYQNEYGQGSAGQYSPSSEFSWGPQMNGQMVEFWSPDPQLADREVPLEAQPDNVTDVFQTGINTSHNLAATMGTENTQARFSYTYTMGNGVIPRNDLQRHNMTVRVNSQLSERLSLDGKLTYNNQTVWNSLPTGENFANPMRHIRRLPRNIRTENAENFEYFTEQGLRRQHFWNPGSNGGANPYWTINRNLNETTRERVIGLASLSFDVTDALNVLVRGSYDGESGRSETQLFNDTFIIADNGQFDLSRSNAFELRGTALVNYQQEIIGDLQVDARAGVEHRSERNEGLFASTGQALTIPNFFAISNTQNVEAAQNVGAPRTVNSVLGSAQFSWRDAVFLDVTGRNDWSSTLPEEDRSFFYPSVGLSTVITDLIPDLFPEPVDFVKLRGSWAEVGNDAQPFMTQRSVSFSAGGNNGFIQVSPTLPAEDLVPEETVSWEAGLNTQFLQGRAGLDFTYFRTSTENQLFSVEAPVGSGARSVFTNGGDIRNQGVEFVLTGVPMQTQDVSWNLETNFSRIRNDVLKISEETSSLTIAQDFLREFRIVEDEPFGQVFSRGFQRDDQGRVVVDDNGIPLTTPGLSVPVANFNPDWTGSIRSSFSYKNLTFSFLIEHRQGGTVSSLTDAILFADGLTEQTLEGRENGVVFGQGIFSDETAVTQDGSPNDIPADPESLWRRLGGRNAPVGEAFVESATNTRMREMTLGYTLPRSLVASLPVERINVTLVGRNLFFIARESDDFDPDLLVGTGNAAEGFDSFSLPTTRKFGMNVSVDF